ncbi:hypothetical protein [Brevibacterium aurantiacum]|uniref:Uncharacterized protein n=1 Tax=Brevibacterium aurantiacum TaxID=273384 RepID=A0A556CDV3_BREAU|nr:hypothetical protein [Brevibacterium aurantiacum]TSI15466.1 hypothetical protein FO013_11950 [Brevibacterium aurantiacum]
MSETEPEGTEPNTDVQRGIEPDTRDWADVLEAGCAECGFTVTSLTRYGFHELKHHLQDVGA